MSNKVRIHFYDDDFTMQIPADHLKNILVSIDEVPHILYEEEDSEPIRIFGNYEDIIRQIEMAGKE